MTDNSHDPTLPGNVPDPHENREAAEVPVSPTARQGFLSRETWKRRPVLAGSLGALGVVLTLGVVSGLSDDNEESRSSEALVIAVVPGEAGLDGSSLEDLLSGIDADRDAWLDEELGDDTRSEDGQGSDQSDQADGTDEAEQENSSLAPGGPANDGPLPSEGNGAPGAANP